GDREVSCGISYLTRFYRLRGPEPGRLNRGFTHGASFDSYSCLVFPADNGAFSITFGVLPEDRDMRALRDPAAFAAAAAAIPAIAPWVDPEVSVPTSDVALMASLSNLLRAPIADAPLGLHSIGDARCVTNPAHTRGTTLALVGAQRLADIVTDHAGDPVAQADAMEAFTACELAAWVEDSVAQDRARLTRWRKGEAPPEPRWVTAVSNGEASVAAQCDGEAWRAFTRLQNALALPGQVLDDSALEAAVARVNRSGWRPPAMEAPDRNELAAIARSAAGAAGS
nr:FAD-dependent oxidoreductase [Actinomycetota bacterium]